MNEIVNEIKDDDGYSDVRVREMGAYFIVDLKVRQFFPDEEDVGPCSSSNDFRRSSRNYQLSHESNQVSDVQCQ